MICLVYFKTDGWPWIHLNEAGSSGSEVVAGRYTVLSLRCRAWGFSLAAMHVTPSLQRIHCLESLRTIRYQYQGFNAERVKKSHALRKLNFNEESPQMGCSQIDSDFVCY